MHILSELRNPLFDAPDRQRALRALQMSRILRENNSAKAWQAVKNMIDKAVSEHNLSPRIQTQKHGSYVSPSLTTTTSLPMNAASNSNTGVYAAMDTIPTYAFQNPSRPYDSHKLPTQPPQMQTQPQPPMLQSMQTIPDHAPCWDDINLSTINNIVGDVQPTTNVIPDFDFVSDAVKLDGNVPLTDCTRVSGVIHSTMRMSLPLCLSKIIISRSGLDEVCNASMNITH
jgi:hypothetical protein